jgi:hypothetical protein
MSERGVITNLRSVLSRVRSKKPILVGNALSRYVRKAPTPENAIAIFKGEWASKFPPPYEALPAGPTELFADERVTWAIDQFDGIEGQDVVELGPLEAGHSYMLQKAGAATITAVESNTGAYLRCLTAKELLNIDRARFLCGDFVEYLRETDRSFDLCVANGVTYHMTNPVELIELIARRADRVMMWTHYYSDGATRARRRASRRMTKAPVASEHAGFAHTLHRHDYGYSLRAAGFCGGPERFANWLSRADLIGALAHFGLTEIVTRDDPGHANGPAIMLVASRPGAQPSS